MKPIKLTILGIMCLCLSAVNAQEALWQLDFEKEVEWTKITDVGILLVAQSDMKLMAFDSRDGSKLWESDIMKGAKGIKGADGKKQDISILFETYLHVLKDEEVPEISDFIEIKYTDNVTFKNFAIINIHTGEELISPRKAGMPVTKLFGKEMPSFNYYGSGYVSSIRAAMISSTYQDFEQKGNPWVSITKVLDLPSGKVRWETDKIGVDVLPVFTDDGNLIMGGKKKIAKIDAGSGSIIWEVNTIEKNQNFASFDVSLDLSTGYYFEIVKKSGQLTAVNLSTGTKEWTTEVKMKVLPQMFAIRDGVIVVGEKWLTLYNLNNGSVKWQAKKAIGIVIDLGDPGIAVAARGKHLMLLDRSNGEVKWDEKIKGISIDQICAKGIMYTDEKGRLGLITFDGEKVWDKKGMLNTPEARFKPEFSSELIYATGTLYAVNLMTGDYSVLMDGIDKEFKEKETPNNLELLEGGYLLSSASNLMMVEPDGSLRWHKYWDAPEKSTFGKIAARTAQTLAIAMAVSSSMASSQYGQAGMNSEAKYYQQQSDNFMNAASVEGAKARKRFTSTKSKGNLQVILAVIGEGGQSKGAGLVKVDKRNGEELSNMVIGDKEPVYDYDPVSGQVFLKSNKKQIISYDL
jgi:outer membrane protein assembly factor BamB